MDKRSLFVEMRDDEVLKDVVKKARSLLAADETFFAVESPNRRIQGIENHAQMARRFVQSALNALPGQLLSVNESARCRVRR